MRIAIAVGVALVLFGAAAVVGVARPDEARSQRQDAGRNVVAVTGVGRIDTVPDRAQLTIGVATQATTAKDAVDENAARMREVVAALRQAGIDEDDVQTQELSLAPRSRRGGGIVGYTATNSVAAESSVEELAGALDAALAAGATRTYGLSLARSDQAELYRRALADAVDDARAKAEALAEAGEFDLGEVVRVEEAESVYAPERLAFDAMAARAPIEPGTSRIEARATVTFALS